MADSTPRPKQPGISDRTLVAAFALALAFLVVSAVLSMVGAKNVLANVDSVDHSQDVNQQIAEVYADIFHLEAAARGHVINPIRSPVSEFRNAKDEVGVSLSDLELLTQDNPRQVPLVSELRLVVATRIADLERVMFLRDTKGMQAAADNPQSAQILAVRKRLFIILTQVRAREIGLMDDRKKLAAKAVELATIGFYCSSAMGFAALTGLFLLASRLVRTQRTLREAESSRAMDLEERVRERTYELSAAVRDLEAFSYSVSHDLRAPLRAMSGYAGILRKDLGVRLDPAEMKLLDRMQVNCVKMSDLIDALLGLFRVAKSDLMIEDIDLSALAKDVLEDVLTDYPSPHLKATISEGMFAVGDRQMLRILLVNLLSNAVKFSSKIASPKVEMGMASSESGTTFFIRDNGAGFDQAQSGLLFEPFQRLHTENEFVGSGIGLAMCRKIVSRHRGDIWLESKLDAGTIVYFTLGIVSPKDSVLASSRLNSN